LAGAVGLWRLMIGQGGGTWIPRLLAIVGVGLALASIFHPDPSGGFPPGTSPSASATSTWHGVVHMICGSAAFLSLIAGCFVFARRFSRGGRRGVAVACRTSGVLFACALALSSGHDGPAVLFAGVSLGWLTFSACTISVLAGSDRRAS
jgi:hypothetical protein